MRINFSCGVCGKIETLELSDKSKVYLIGRDFEGLDVKLCSDEKHTLSRIQAHIKWDRNSWRIFDGWPPENVSRQSSGINKPSSFGGTFVKKPNGDTRLLPYGTGEDLMAGETVYFVATGKADRGATERWLKQAGADAQAAFYKYNSFVFKEDYEYYDGFKYKLTVSSEEEQAKKMRANNIFVPVNFSKELEPGREHLNSCVALDIRSSTEADLETQREYWIPQFNAILNSLLTDYSDYLLILMGDGAYVCFLGQREEADVNFNFAVKFLDKLAACNATNRQKKITPWKIRLAVNNGKDLLAQVEIAGIKCLNVYGNTITTLARLMSYGKSQGDEIMVGIPFHQEFNNKKYYKTNYTQTVASVTDNHDVLHHYYVYKKKTS